MQRFKGLCVSHDLGEVKEVCPKENTNISSYKYVLKDDGKPSQFNILQKRASARAEEAKYTFRENKGNHWKKKLLVKSKGQRLRMKKLKLKLKKQRANTKLILADAEKL